MIVVRKPAVHRWPAFSIVCRFPLIQFFLTSFSRKSLSHSNFCRKNIKVSAVLCLELFSSGCFFQLFDVFFFGFFLYLSWQYREYRKFSVCHHQQSPSFICLPCLFYNHNHYWDPGYLAAKYGTLSAGLYLELIFFLRICLLQICLLPLQKHPLQ